MLLTVPYPQLCQVLKAGLSLFVFQAFPVCFSLIEAEKRLHMQVLTCIHVSLTGVISLRPIKDAWRDAMKPCTGRGNEEMHLKV